MTSRFEASIEALARQAGTQRRRHDSIDVLRGLAVLAMIVFHATWTAAYFAYLPPDTLDGPVGRWSARIITAVFLFVVGVSLVLAHEAGLDRRRFFRRILMLAGAAFLVSAATIHALPQTPIYFGVLHCIVVSSLLALPFLRLAPRWSLIGAVCVFLLMALRWVIDDAGQPFIWLGIGSAVPPMADYVPLVPWFGLVLLGLGAARIARLRDLLFFGLPVAASPLRFVGRHALPIYLLHQPLLFGLALGLQQLGVKPASSVEKTQCIEACIARSGAAKRCEDTCLCIEDKLAEPGVGRAVDAVIAQCVRTVNHVQ
jgi:uncharacterized membrane protein